MAFPGTDWMGSKSPPAIVGWLGLLLLALGLSVAHVKAGGLEDASAQDTAGILSEKTAACIDCHAIITPGIVANWQRGRHARTTVSAAEARPRIGRRISAAKVPAELRLVSVGCAECHGLRPDEHADSFDHNGFDIHLVVTPPDCATCHPAEVNQYSQNLMSSAFPNLAENALYMTLVTSITGIQRLDGTSLATEGPDEITHAESCFYCHGTRVTVGGTVSRETAMGKMEFPGLSGWPNQGVGRVNPDGSQGACSACHTRHRFSIEMARKPATCAECHKGPDVPAYKVYSVSKHGNLYAAEHDEWDFEPVPWVPGRDFAAPTCAVCHVSLLASEDGEVVADRTHRMNDRSAWRIFGLPYAHPHPRSANTTAIRNRAGLPLPTELTGEPAEAFLIDAAEMGSRRERMMRVCQACHASSWVEPQFARIDHTIAETNEMTLTATKILMQAWEQGLAKGPEQGGNPFDEAIEKMWIEQWLFYANSVRFASAMGGADYGSFANGRWSLSYNLRRMHDWVTLRSGRGQER